MTVQIPILINNNVLILERPNYSAPTVTTTPGTSGQVGVAYSETLAATPGNAYDSHTWSLVTKPTGMTINERTGAIAWTPSAGQEGSNQVVALCTNRYGLTDGASWYINTEAVGGSGGGGVTVSGFTGTVISGGGFGTEGATNVVYDNFDDGACNTTAKVGSWASTNLITSVAEESRHAVATYAAYHNFLTDGTAGFRCVSEVLSRKWFVQYWVKLDSFDWGTGAYGSNSQHLSNVKFLRFWNPGSTTENFYTQFWWSLTSNAYTNPENVAGQTTNNYDTPLNKSDVSDSAWHCLQFEFVDSSAPSQSDGEFRMWFDGQLMEERVGFVGRTADLLKRPLFIGFFNAWGPNTGAGETNRDPNHYYMHDVYAVPTLARVEVGNNTVYGSCTHREIQIPTAWAAGQITITPNQGSFADDDECYLFVVNENGEVSSGYGPFTFGGL